MVKTPIAFKVVGDVIGRGGSVEDAMGKTGFARGYILDLVRLRTKLINGERVKFKDFAYLTGVNTVDLRAAGVVMPEDGVYLGDARVMAADHGVAVQDARVAALCAGEPAMEYPPEPEPAVEHDATVAEATPEVRQREPDTLTALLAEIRDILAARRDVLARSRGLVGRDAALSNGETVEIVHTFLAGGKLCIAYAHRDGEMGWCEMFGGAIRLVMP